MCKSVLFLILNLPITTKVVCFSRLLKCLRSLYGKQCEPRSDCSYIGAVCFGSTLFASVLNLSVMLGNYLQQTTSADNIFRCIFSLRVKFTVLKNRVLEKSLNFTFNKILSSAYSLSMPCDLVIMTFFIHTIDYIKGSAVAQW